MSGFVRGELSLEQVKLAKRKSADPFNASEQDNPPLPTILKEMIIFIISFFIQF